MNQKNVLKSFFPYLLISLMVSVMMLQFKLASTANLPALKISAQDSALNINHQLINTIHLGQKRLIASLIWIETLMNSDLEHYNNDDLNSWMYHRFNALIELDPNFYEVYRYGGQYLSIVKDDEIGAEDIYRRGLEVFPDDFWLNFHAGFHYFFEMDRPRQAIPFFEKIAFTTEGSQNAPYLPSLITKMKVNVLGVSEELFAMTYNAYIQSPPTSPISQRLFSALYAIRCQLDLDCINSKKGACRQKDLNGDLYYYSASERAFVAKNSCSVKLKTRH